jgi:hypothetical protein
MNVKDIPNYEMNLLSNLNYKRFILMMEDDEAYMNDDKVINLMDLNPKYLKDYKAITDFIEEEDHNKIFIFDTESRNNDERDFLLFVEGMQSGDYDSIDDYLDETLNGYDDPNYYYKLKKVFSKLELVYFHERNTINNTSYNEIILKVKDTFEIIHLVYKTLDNEIGNTMGVTSIDDTNKIFSLFND